MGSTVLWVWGEISLAANRQLEPIKIRRGSYKKDLIAMTLCRTSALVPKIRIYQKLSMAGSKGLAEGAGGRISRESGRGFVSGWVSAAGWCVQRVQCWGWHRG